ncbi:MAG: hypothetical protein Q4G54_03545 [Pelistega sp.]|nr:hypothetical protein [Pelistega sp.]
MKSRAFTFEQAKSEFDYVVSSYEDIQAKEIAEICTYSKLSPEMSDTNILKNGGKEWLIEPFRGLQPLSYSVLQNHASDYMVGFRWIRKIPRPALPRNQLKHNGFLVINNTVLWVNIAFRIYKEKSLPEAIENSWLKNASGWRTTSDIVPVN